jgi:predicted nucleotide-binding protein
VTADPRTVWVVHGRNMDARQAVFTFLRSLNLQPLEWSQAVRATGSGAPYIGEVRDKAFEVAQAVVVLFTPDEIAYLRGEYASGMDDDQTRPAAQARPNVLF